jgi:hypothetical protein
MQVPDFVHRGAGHGASAEPRGDRAEAQVLVDGARAALGVPAGVFGELCAEAPLQRGVVLGPGEDALAARAIDRRKLGHGMALGDGWATA